MPSGTSRKKKRNHGLNKTVLFLSGVGFPMQATECFKAKPSPPRKLYYTLCREMCSSALIIFHLSITTSGMLAHLLNLLPGYPLNIGMNDFF